jgi:hypothetical protein
VPRDAEVKKRRRRRRRRERRVRLSSSLERKNEKKNDEFCLDFVDVFSKIKNEKEERKKNLPKRSGVW